MAREAGIASMPENEGVTVVVTLTQKDYATFMRAQARGGTGLAGRLLFWGSVAFLCWMLYSLLRSSDGPLLGGVLVAVGVTLFLFVFYYLLPSLSARFFVKKNPNKLGPAKVSIGPQGLAYEGVHGEGTAKWSAYQKIRETKDLFLLYSQSNFAQILPKRCFEMPDEPEKLRRILRTHYKGKLNLLK